MKREVWLLQTGFGIAPVNKLVSVTWLLWALRSFRSFTLQYIIVIHISTCFVCWASRLLREEIAAAEMAAVDQRKGSADTNTCDDDDDDDYDWLWMSSFHTGGCFRLRPWI